MFIYTAMPHLLLAGCTTRLSPTPFAAVHDQSPFLLPVLTYAFPRINSAEMSMAGAQPCTPSGPMSSWQTSCPHPQLSL